MYVHLSASEVRCYLFPISIKPKLYEKLIRGQNMKFQSIWMCVHVQDYHYGYGYSRWATSWTVPGSIPGGVTGDFFLGSFRQNHVPWGRLSLWKWVPGTSPEVKAAGAYGWRPTTLVVPNVEMIQGLNLPGTPRATSACRGTSTCSSINNRCSYSTHWSTNCMSTSQQIKVLTSV